MFWADRIAGEIQKRFGTPDKPLVIRDEKTVSGRVVKVLVVAGAEIAAGTPCVVVEAMKMENELRSPIDGKVAAVHVTEGVSVEGQALLVSFE